MGNPEGSDARIEPWTQVFAVQMRQSRNHRVVERLQCFCYSNKSCSTLCVTKDCFRGSKH